MSSYTHITAPNLFIDIDGTKYAYRTFGNDSGIPLLLLQHFTGTLDNWDPIVTNGLAKQFKVILFDNKGIGASTGKTPDNIGAMAQDAISFIKALGVDKVNILGFSMGGFIAQQITLDAPDLVNKLILAGTGPKGGERISDIMGPLTESSTMDPYEQKLFLFYSQTETSRTLGKRSLDRINKRKVNRDPETGIKSVQAQLTSILKWAAPTDDSLERLKKIKQPVFIANGNNDTIVPTINSYIMFQNMPDAKLSLYPDSGHGSIFQFPELFLMEAINFLKTN
jgi:pimeloyl-ACP methyl ester carboxylesterase